MGRDHSRSDAGSSVRSGSRGRQRRRCSSSARRPAPHGGAVRAVGGRGPRRAIRPEGAPLPRCPDEHRPVDPPRGGSTNRPATSHRCRRRSPSSRVSTQRDPCAALTRRRRRQRQIQQRFQRHVDRCPARPVVYPLLEGDPASRHPPLRRPRALRPAGADEGICLVEGPPINPVDDPWVRLSSRAPFVFLNACQVGAAARTCSAAMAASHRPSSDRCVGRRGAPLVHRRRDRPEDRPRLLPAGSRADGRCDRCGGRGAGPAGRRSDPARVGCARSRGHPPPGAARGRPGCRRAVLDVPRLPVLRPSVVPPGMARRRANGGQHPWLSSIRPAEPSSWASLGCAPRASPARPMPSTSRPGAALRSVGGTSHAFQAALDRAEMETTHVIEIQASRASRHRGWSTGAVAPPAGHRDGARRPRARQTGSSRLSCPSMPTA